MYVYGFSISRFVDDAGQRIADNGFDVGAEDAVDKLIYGQIRSYIIKA